MQQLTGKSGGSSCRCLSLPFLKIEDEHGSSNAMLPSHLSETKKHGRSPFSGTECSKVCLRALPCGAETCATRILSSVKDERTVKYFTTNCLAVATGSGGWVKTQCENTCSVRRALIGAAEDGHAMQSRTKSSRHQTTVNKTRYMTRGRNTAPGNKE